MEKKIAIYSRKSKFTESGDSIDNQIDMCKNYLLSKSDTSILERIKIYEDEGFSGATTNRPQFQQMMEDIKNGDFEKIIVYRLDRISRNVLDFCALKDQLAKLNIDFVSISENFDTSSPIGAAMLMITSVFAQLERDTIAQRIKDNMTSLAKYGYWLGGTTPLGYTSIEKNFIEKKKIKKFYQLKINNDEAKTITIIYNQYLKFKSINKLEIYLKEKGIKTRKGNNFSRHSLREILKNPVYVIASEKIIKYFKEKRITIYTNNLTLTKNYGLIAYNKRIQTKTKKNNIQKSKMKPINEWIIAIGYHQGIISSTKWITAQNLIQSHTRHT